MNQSSAMVANYGTKKMTKSTTDKIIEWIMTGTNSNDWFEKNKKEFIRKNNPKYYETLYGKTRNNK